MSRKKRCVTTSPNQIQFNSTVLFILQDWLWTSNAANVSCTRFCSKGTDLHATIMCREFDPGWFSRKENCTSLFTDKFGIITEVHALGKLDPESLYITWPKQCIWTQKSAFSETQQKDKPRTTLNVQSRTIHWKKVQIKFCWKLSVLSILNDSQSKAVQVSCTGFSSKAPELQSCHSVNWVSTRFILQWKTVYCTVHWWHRVHNALDPQSLYIN